MESKAITTKKMGKNLAEFLEANEM